MAKVNTSYYIPSGLDKDFCELIIKKMQNVELEDAKTFSNDRIRASKVQWMNTDSWIAGMMQSWVHYANMNAFHWDLSSWDEKIQYTVYNKGDRYGWHCDTEHGPASEFVRKVSISLCLSDASDYEGGELQIKLGDSVQNVKMSCGDVMVFPSDALHRVRTITSGTRVSLVGWFGGPRFI